MNPRFFSSATSSNIFTILCNLFVPKRLFIWKTLAIAVATLFKCSKKHITKIPTPKPPYVTFDTLEIGKVTTVPPSTFTFTIWVPYVKHYINGIYISQQKMYSHLSSASWIEQFHILWRRLYPKKRCEYHFAKSLISGYKYKNNLHLLGRHSWLDNSGGIKSNKSW